MNTGSYEGTARLVSSPAEFDRIQPGDVLVTRMTSPYFNVVLPLLGAIVTDRGGQLCHAAIVAREYGIPGIVGTREATAQDRRWRTGPGGRLDRRSPARGMSGLSCVAALSAAGDAGRFGGKAAQLAAARRAGLPVPDGWALGWDEVEALVLEETSASEVDAALRAAVSGRGPVAVRSSAVGEDSRDASFAGTHLTVLGLLGGQAVVDAVRQVHASAADPGALAYRDRLAVDGAIRMGVVVQDMVDADVAGVLFTRNPLTGADELVIEASWGSG